jgi:uncharacterized protein
MRKRILVVAVAVVLIAAAACAFLALRREGSRGILYRVTGEHASAYLLGSIHIGTPEMHPFGDALEEAMADAGVFVFESDTASADSLRRLKARQALPEDATLQGVLGDALYADVAAAFKALGLGTTGLDRSRPWAVINTLALYSSAEEMGVDNVNKAVSLGVEAAVRAYAAGHAKAFAYLETIDEVADTMESFSDALNRYLLQDEADVVLGRKQTSDMDTLKQWPSWWRDGNADAFRAFYSQSFGDADQALYEEYHDKLVARRNALMADRLDELMRQGGTYFVTVGLLHLVPEDDSILSLLREKGYTVERVAQP